MTSQRTSNSLPRASLVSVVLLMAFMVTLAPQRAAAQNRQAFPWRVTGVVVNNGQLFAIIDLRGATDVVPINLTSSPSGSPQCPILNLELGAIDLTLLGLRVQTSDICLDITARRGGGLLGDLLCQVANLLNRGLSLSDVLRSLGPRNTSLLLSGLTNLIQGVLDRVTGGGTLTDQIVGGCRILHLELGPLDLNLLGLMVHLDDCDNGPVTVDITAIPGGGLLGGLLCSLANQALPLETFYQLLVNTILGLLA